MRRGRVKCVDDIPFAGGAALCRRTCILSLEGSNALNANVTLNADGRIRGCDFGGNNRGDYSNRRVRVSPRASPIYQDFFDVANMLD